MSAGDAAAGVAHRHQLRARRATRHDLARVSGRIAQQIVEHLHHPGRIADQGVRAAIRTSAPAQALRLAGG